MGIRSALLVASVWLIVGCGHEKTYTVNEPTYSGSKLSVAAAVRHSLEGGTKNPFLVGDECVFFIETESALNPGELLVLKILPASPSNIKQVRNKVGG